MCVVCLWGLSLQLMVTGDHGSHGENALLLVGVDRGHVSDFVIARLLVTVAGRVQETPPSCPGVTFRPAQVRNVIILYVFVCFCVCVVVHTRTALKALVYLLSLSGGPQKARGSIIGNINDMEFGIAILNATITDNKSGGKVIKAFITNVPRTLGQFTKHLFP